MQGFTLERFAADGALRVQVQGARLRHYPDTDTMDILRHPAPRATAPDGSVTVASALLAVSNGGWATQVQLQGGARVRREASAVRRCDRVEEPVPARPSLSTPSA